MRRTYLVKMEARNDYRLRYTEDGTIPSGYKKITRKEAERLAEDERTLRENCREISGYADTLIYPYDITTREMCLLDGSTRRPGEKGVYILGYMVYRRK